MSLPTTDLTTTPGTASATSVAPVDPLTPSAWDGMPAPSKTFGHLMGRGVRRCATAGRGLLARLGVLASQRAWLAWACGVGLFAVGGAVLVTLWFTITRLVWPTLAWMVSGLDPAGALPLWARGTIGLMMVVIGAGVLRLAVSLFLDYPARFWVALSLLARPEQDVPAEHRTRARQWLLNEGLARGLVALILLTVLVSTAWNVTPIVKDLRSMITSIATRTITIDTTATPGAPSPEALRDASLPLTIQWTLDAVANGQASTFDLARLEAVSDQVISRNSDGWQDMNATDRDAVLASKAPLAMWAFLPALDAYTSNLVKTADAQKADALARGATGEASTVVQTAQDRLTRLNNALWLLTGQEFPAVNIGATMAQWHGGGVLDYLAQLPTAPGTGLRMPGEYGCAIHMDVPAPFAPTRMSPDAMQARANVLKRYASLDDDRRRCSTAGGWDAFSTLRTIR